MTQCTMRSCILARYFPPTHRLVLRIQTKTKQVKLVFPSKPLFSAHPIWRATPRHLSLTGRSLTYGWDKCLTRKVINRPTFKITTNRSSPLTILSHLIFSIYKVQITPTFLYFFFGVTVGWWYVLRPSESYHEDCGEFAWQSSSLF